MSHRMMLHVAAPGQCLETDGRWIGKNLSSETAGMRLVSIWKGVYHNLVTVA